MGNQKDICGNIQEKERKAYTYIVQCRDGSYYTGWTTDVDKRVAAHNAGKGAKYTKSRRPVKLVYYEVFDSKGKAMHREYEIKQMPRIQKTRLIYGISPASKQSRKGCQQTDPALFQRGQQPIIQKHTLR